MILQDSSNLGIWPRGIFKYVSTSLYRACSTVSFTYLKDWCFSFMCFLIMSASACTEAVACSAFTSHTWPKLFQTGVRGWSRPRVLEIKNAFLKSIQKRPTWINSSHFSMSSISMSGSITVVGILFWHATKISKMHQILLV